MNLDWMEDAACTGMDTDSFVPKHGTRWGRITPAVREALAVCKRCPVASPCLDYAMKTRSYGVWGGRFLTPSTHAKAHRGEPRAPGRRLLRECGTEAAYRRHLRYGEKPCEACAEAIRRSNVRRGHPLNR